jgi:osmoprotectant transport system ATP-binding protein
LLELSDVHKAFGNVRAVAGLNLVVEAGRTTLLIGPSGCGKSTLLRMMNGLVVPDRGTVRWEGENLHPENIQAVRHRQGYVIQEGGLFPHLTAHDNISLLVRYLGWNERRVDARLRKLADLTRLPVQALSRFPRELSGGQRQRVSLMRALMPDPELLLLDEPLGALDPMIRAELQVDLKVIFDALDKTVVIVTHDLAEAEFFADTIVLMRAGEIVQTGEMRDLVERPASPFVSQFVEAQRTIHLRE